MWFLILLPVQVFDQLRKPAKHFKMPQFKGTSDSLLLLLSNSPVPLPCSRLKHSRCSCFQAVDCILCWVNVNHCIIEHRCWITCIIIKTAVPQSIINSRVIVPQSIINSRVIVLQSIINRSVIVPQSIINSRVIVPQSIIYRRVILPQ